jgi:hypothetical protein
LSSQKRRALLHPSRVFTAAAPVCWADHRCGTAGRVCGLDPMKANAAVYFLLAGSSLASVRRVATSRASGVIGEVIGAIVALIGTLTLAESVTGTNRKIDRRLY